MSSAPHVRGVKVLKAVSSPVRLQILNLLFDRGALSYTELINSLKMNPNRDAGRFAYHLKFLLKTDLIEVEVEAKKYCLTDLGKMVIDIADHIEKKASKPKSMMVRESRFALEEFDANKIANSLIKEAKMPPELAQKTAKEAEKRLLKSKTKYLTSPLVREIVNAILVEKGFEDYRHKYTRLGLPVHEVTMLLEGSGKSTRSSIPVREKAGEAMLMEYTLLKALPRDISDAHLSGALHICDLDSWILRPSEISHDMRFFFEDELTQKHSDKFRLSNSPPQTFESALATVLNGLLYSAREITGTQTLDYFNVFLAPFAKQMESSRVRESLHSFILNVNQHVEAAFGVELTVPDFLAAKPAVGPSGKTVGKYGNFLEESQLLASLVLEIMAEQSMVKPMLSPRVFVKIRPEVEADQRARALLLKAHYLASERGILYFASCCAGGQKMGSFSGSGFKFQADLTGDWELDTLRSGALGVVVVNLPRIAYESRGDEAKFIEILGERLEMASRAFDIKYGAVKQHGEKLLPFLMQSANGDQYFRLANSLRLVNLVGFREMLQTFLGKPDQQDLKAAKFIEKVASCLAENTSKSSRKGRKKLVSVVVPDDEAAERLAQLDVDRYGLGKVKFSGTRERPFYSTINVFAFEGIKMPIGGSIVEHDFKNLCEGGSLSAIDVGSDQRSPDELYSLTMQFAEHSGSEFFTYDRRVTYCSNCRKSWLGVLPKCPSCASVGTLVVYDRFPLCRVKQ